MLSDRSLRGRVAEIGVRHSNTFIFHMKLGQTLTQKNVPKATCYQQDAEIGFQWRTLATIMSTALAWMHLKYRMLEKKIELFDEL